MKISRRSSLKKIAAGVALSPLGSRLVRGRAPAGAAERFVRFERDGRRSYGRIDGDRVKEFRGSPFEAISETGESFPLAEVKLLAPCEPSKVLAMALNYRSHSAGGADQVPKNPEVFIKAPSAILEPGGTIVIPKGTQDVHYEGELVVVIGKKAKDVAESEALSYVFGYTCGNDVSARDWQKNDRQWWRAKASDTFAPLGPWIVRGIDPGKLLLTTRLNGEVKQKSPTSELIFGVPTIVSFVSVHMTLLPGDVIFTGTPGQTSPMKPGDTVEVEIDGIGVLRNRIAG